MGVSFDNCLIQAPDGENLSRCSIKKAKWYLKKNLADVVDNNPTTIRLKFEPRGREGTKDPLLNYGKPNLCVVCGSQENLTRHHIVPYCYIKYMEVKYKVDVVRDIFLLCEQCHGDYEKIAFDKKKELAESFGLTMDGLSLDKVKEIRHAVLSASALINYDSIPENRKKELESIVSNFLNKETIDSKDLKYVATYDWKKSNDYCNSSKKVAYNVDYNEFAKEWRTHFIETMSPKYMPNAWKIDRDSNHVWIPKRFEALVRRS